MSLVGPRPPLPEEFAQYEEWQCGKLAVKPGITCVWQVSGRSEISDFRTWARLDLQYIRDWNLWLDFQLLLRTIPAVLSGRGAY
jgi:lipopolysaccharide/colanic/teichoic acid biosynthesis glycosyltransferase